MPDITHDKVYLGDAVYAQFDGYHHAKVSRTEFLTDLRAMVPFLNEEGKTKLRSLITRFKVIFMTSDVLEAELNFDAENIALYRTLHEIIPSITYGEKRLCVLLKKGHSYSDIATILCKSKNTTTVAMARIRYKFAALSGRKVSKKQLIEILRNL